ncbi:amidohydrolase 2 [Lyophyllum atratum]|nr:amidohydrolase 2 [Lyophyllum atratum]
MRSRPFTTTTFTLGFLCLLHITTARKWRDSGTGSIALEEAWTIPELLNTVSKTPPLGLTVDEFTARFTDVHGRRLDLMNEYNIDYMVLSCANPCVQGISDPAAAAAMAINVNNQLAAAISNNTERFGGFASLAMHNATEAARELRRAVKELGFLGALVNDYQQSGPDNTTLLFYDQPEYDVFWQAVTDLDVPIYFHPRGNVAPISTLMYTHAPFLKGPAEEFAVTLSNHILGLCTNGVFDRFPALKIIVGHLGERLTSDLFRIDEQLRRSKPFGLVMQRNVSDYWRTNLYETTSGNFATPLLKFHMGEIGLDRIMYSVDYPFVLISEGEAWIQSLSKVISKSDLQSLKRGVAIKLLNLDD